MNSIDSDDEYYDKIFIEMAEADVKNHPEVSSENLDSISDRIDQTNPLDSSLNLEPSKIVKPPFKPSPEYEKLASKFLENEQSNFINYIKKQANAKDPNESSLARKVLNDLKILPPEDSSFNLDYSSDCFENLNIDYSSELSKEEKADILILNKIKLFCDDCTDDCTDDYVDFYY